LAILQGQILTVFSFFPLRVLGWLSLKRPAAGIQACERVYSARLHR
jgi:hypothetical protein